MKAFTKSKMSIFDFRLQLCLLFILASIFAFFLPYTCDDWIWGTDYAVSHYLSNWFEGYNGRYLGNLIIMAITRSHMLRVLLMAVCITCMVYLMGRIADTDWAFGFVMISLLFMPKEIFSQTFAWTSGFANYVTSAIPPLFLLYDCWTVFEKKRKEASVLSAKRTFSIKDFGKAVLVGMLMFLGSLIMENITIYNVILSFVLLLFCFVRQRHLQLKYAAALLGSIAAAFVMFSNSAYGLISTPEEIEIRSRKIFAFADILKIALDNWYQIIYLQVFRNHIFLLSAFAVVLFLLHYKNTHAMTKRVRMLSDLSLTLFSVYVIWEILLRMIHNGEALYGTLQMIDAAATAIAIVFFIITVLAESYYIGSMAKPLLLIFSVSVLSGPLFVVNPVSARCFFMPYVLLTLLLCELLKSLTYAYSGAAWKVFKERGYRIVFVVLLGQISFYTFIYGSNHIADAKRLQYVNDQIEAGLSSVTLYYLPYDSYLFVSTPYNEWPQSVSQYKEFYGIPQDIKLKYANVEDAFSGVLLNRSNLIFKDEKPVKLTAEAFIPYQPEAVIHWTSSDSSVAKVDEKGLVTPLSYGSCTITAEAADTEYTASCSISVPWLAKSSSITAEPASDGIMISWEEVRDAVGYMLYRKETGGEFEQLAYIPDGKQLRYKDIHASLDEYSYYYVFPVGNIDGVTVMGLKTDEYAFGTRCLPEVRNFNAHNNMQGDVVLTWNEVSEADGYLIQVKRGSDGYLTELADVPAGSGAYYIDTEAPNDALSFYWITAYKNSRSSSRIMGTISEYINAYSKK